MLTNTPEKPWRWASNRIIGSEHGSIVAFVTNGGYIDGNTADGLRLTLADEFHHLYIYNLRGNARTLGERRRKEAGNIFESGSRATVAIMLLIKQPGPVSPGAGIVHYRDIGDYLSRDQKLGILDGEMRSSGIAAPSLDDIGWETIEPNQHGDWINQRSDEFAAHVAIQSKDEPSIFEARSRGLLTSRDIWNYNSSPVRLRTNVERMIDHYNRQVDAVDAFGDVGLSRIYGFGSGRLGVGMASDNQTGEAHGAFVASPDGDTWTLYLADPDVFPDAPWVSINDIIEFEDVTVAVGAADGGPAVWWYSG